MERHVVLTHELVEFYVLVVLPPCLVVLLKEIGSD
jgi:hypothetical protein